MYGSSTVVINHSTINSPPSAAGHLTAANTSASTPVGYVIMNSTITGSGTNQTDLGRPWQFATGSYSNVMYIDDKVVCTSSAAFGIPWAQTHCQTPIPPAIRAMRQHWPDRLKRAPLQPVPRTSVGRARPCRYRRRAAHVESHLWAIQQLGFQSLGRWKLDDMGPSQCRRHIGCDDRHHSNILHQLVAWWDMGSIHPTRHHRRPRTRLPDTLPDRRCAACMLASTVPKNRPSSRCDRALVKLHWRHFNPLDYDASARFPSRTPEAFQCLKTTGQLLIVT